MANKFIYVLAACAGLLGSTACTDLDSNVYSAYNTSIFPQNEEDVNALLVGGVYAPFRSDRFEGLFCTSNRGVQIYNDMCTDLGDCRWQDVYWFDLINVNFNTNHKEGAPLIYRNNISCLSRMSNIIKTIKQMNIISEDNKNKLLAQAYCGRGWLAYILYDMFGRIQIPTEESLNNPAENIIVPRSTDEETVKYIEDNLLEAVKYLPKTIPYGNADYGRFTAGAAYTILMHLYMHEQRWAEAVEVGNELMKPDYGYQLVPDYKDIFTLENEGNKETIWACTEDHGINIQLWLSEVLPSTYPTKNPKIQKWNGYRIPWQFYHSYEQGDRRLLTICAKYTSNSGLVYSEAYPRGTLDLGALPIKYGEDPEDTGSGSSIDYIVLRYADVLTLQAEALARKANSVTQEAVDLLNMVRQRAGIPTYKVGDFGSLESFLDAVLTERGHELYFEGWRRSDLIRHGKFIEYAKLYKKSRTAAPHHVLFPLPQEIINEGRGLVIQNEGY